MEHAQRTTAAVVVATLVGAGGVAAAVNGVADSTSAADAGSADQSAADHRRADLAATLHDIAAGSRRLDVRLTAARRELARESRELRLERALSLPAVVSDAAARTRDATGSPAPAVAPAAPTTHTTTGASGASSTTADDDRDEATEADATSHEAGDDD
jgi:hypothetical protein